MTAIILAGGKSRRLGQDKAWLKIDGLSIIQRILDCLNPIFEEVLIVGPESQQFQQLGIRIIPDELPDAGPLGGLYSGLNASRNDWVFCCACDMPFLNSELITMLKNQINREDALICKWSDKIHPLHSFYKKTCLPVIQKNLDCDQRRMLDILHLLSVKYLDENFISRYDSQGKSFFNLNTLDDLAKVICS